MKTQLRILAVICLALLMGSAISFAQTTRTVPGDAATIQAAINASSNGDIVQLLVSTTYNEAVTINVQNLTLQGVDATSIIDPPSGNGITVTANGVTIKNLEVTGAATGISANGVSSLTINGVTSISNTGAGAQLLTVATASITNSTFSSNLDEGLNIVGGSSMTLSGVTASSNGTGVDGSGVDLKGVTGPSSLTNTTASSNHRHGISVGDGSTSVTIDGGTFNSNGQSGDATTGGGINIVAQGGTTTTSVTVQGTVTASNNMAAGIYVYAASNTDNLSTINIGDGTNTITVSNNGSGGATPGGAGVVVVGKVSGATINKVSFTKGAAPGAGVMVLKNGSNDSPTGTVVSNCTFASDYDATHPVATLDDNQGHASVNNITASTGNSITGVSDGFAREDLIVHKLDNATLGLVTTETGNLYVTTSSGSIQRGIDAASAGNTVHVGSGTFAESPNVNKSLTLAGVDTSAKVHPSSGNGITVAANSVTISDLVVYGAPSNGIIATGRTGLTLTGVVSRNNTGSGTQLNTCSTVSVTGGSYSGNLDEGFNTLGGTSYTMSNVVASGNGTGSNGSGVNLKGVNGTSTVTGLTASNNHHHGISVGDSASGITISGGTFNGNGTAGDAATGAGINIVEQLGNASATTSSIALQGSITSSNNTSAGVYVYAAGNNDAISGVTIGDNTNTITISGNGSTGVSTGGAGIVVAGNAATTLIKKVSLSKGSANPQAGIANLGTDNSGTNSPTGTDVQNSTFTGYTSANPFVTLTDGNGHTSTNDVTASNNTFSFPVAAKVFLQGPYSGGTMTTTLSTGHYVSTTQQPYNVAPFSYAGSETPADTNVFVNQSVTDWVLVELRSTFNGAAVSRRAALLKNDGTILETDGTAGVSCTQTVASGYTIWDYIVVKHRNHLAVMTKDSLKVPNEASSYDFTTAQTQAFDPASLPMSDLGGGTTFGMIAGDASANGQIKYIGGGNDRGLILTRVGGAFGGTVNGYYPEDLNLNGQVKYIGGGNDRGIVLTSIGGAFGGTKSTTVP